MRRVLLHDASRKTALLGFGARALAVVAGLVAICGLRGIPLVPWPAFAAMVAIAMMYGEAMRRQRARLSALSNGEPVASLYAQRMARRRRQLGVSAALGAVGFVAAGVLALMHERIGVDAYFGNSRRALAFLVIIAVFGLGDAVFSLRLRIATDNK